MDKNYETVRRIMLSTNKIDGVYYLFAKQLGVNENTLAFFYALADRQPHSQKEISNEWLIPRTTINSIVKTMLKDGYIMFCGNQHTKEKALVLTETGQKYTDKLLADIYSIEKKAIVQTLKNYPPEFVSALEDFSNRLYNEFQEIYQCKKEHSKNE
jgi:DNA-binding MarR family transcriptional regulator